MGCNETVAQDWDDDEKPAAVRTVPTFQIDRTEVTMAAYAACAAARACGHHGLREATCSGTRDPNLDRFCNWKRKGR